MRRLRPTRSTALLAVVVVLLATVPVLVPLLVTRAGSVPAPHQVPAAAETAPALPRAVLTPEPIGASPTGAGGVRSTPAAPATSPTASPTPTPTRSRTPDRTRGADADPGPRPTIPAGTPTPAPPRRVEAAGADLLIVSVTWSPRDPRPGDQVTFIAVVRNAGTRATPADTVHGVAFSVDGRTVTWSARSADPLAPGGLRTYPADAGLDSSTWSATAGSHEILVHVDDIDRIHELDEGNNLTTTRLTV